jgi:NAD(P)-dependent dehydrogenase (short-subunit alcohol dehydrogenase family)
MKVHGKTIIVTGAGNGIGREVSLELLRRGAKVEESKPDLHW